METTVIEKKENKLLNRLEVKFSLTYEEKPPKRSDVQTSLAAKLGAKPELVMVQKVANVFGVRKMMGRANVYKDKTELEKLERKQIKKRWGVKATEEKSAEQPAAEEASKQANEVEA
ncbi:MAG TPA: hypothetical protein ENN30_01920 [Candidatus Woesearchaeota archaeon]|nr:hypothetical protein [Candidatus Woesearchaeota archaeon]